jgi:hypothetical protein
VSILSFFCDLRKDGAWLFTINHNTTADYFLAFDNRKDLNPLHVWLLPGIVFSHLASTGIRPSTIDKWDAYQQDISKINTCCDTIRGTQEPAHRNEAV